MEHKRIILSLFLLGAFSTLRAQEAVLKLGDRHFEDLSFVEAIAHYERAFHQAEPDLDHLRRMAQCHWNLRDSKGSEQWYGRVCTSLEADAEDVYRYAEALRANGKHLESDHVLERFAKLAPQDSRAERKANAHDRLAVMLDEPGIAQKVVPVGFNSEKSDMAPFIRGNTLLFASARAPEYTARRHHTWDDQPFLDLYTATVDPSGNVRDVHTLRDQVNSRYHESNAVISPDGMELYFTRNNFHAGHSTLGENGFNNLQIFVRQREGEGWSREKAFVHNHADRSVGHPALGPDGNTLYFTSDMPGGRGGKDIYKCERSNGGAWGEPVNLGTTVNTEGDEMFPYVARDGRFYFASDGHLGLGGLDLFRCEIGPNGFTEPQNLNAPVNSPSDDLGLCLDVTGTRGYLTSDRPGGAGGDDIYTFVVEEGPARTKEVVKLFLMWRGRVVDADDATPVAHLPIRLLDEQRQELARTVTGSDGTYEFAAPEIPAIVEASIEGAGTVELPVDESVLLALEDVQLPDIKIQSLKDLPVKALVRDGMSNAPLAGVAITVTEKSTGKRLYTGTTDENGSATGVVPGRRFGENADLEVTFERDGYITKTVAADFRVLGFLEQSLSGPEGEELSPVMVGIDIGKAMNLRPIYFDYRSDKIRTDAAGELDLVAQVMRLNPTIRIDLRSHTDSRASAAYNDELSRKRAASTRAYLIGEGIDAERIAAHGYGERELVNHCTDGVECSEADHQMNRRTEFIITAVDGMTLNEKRK